MPYVETDLIKPDENDDVWRYVSLLKFIDLLETNTLWMSRADKLGDSWEGAVPMLPDLGHGKSEQRALIMVDAFDHWPEPVAIGRVEYSNYEPADWSLDPNDLVHPCFRKRLNFESESEVRALSYDEGDVVRVQQPGGHETVEGKRVPMNLDALIEAVYVAPRRSRDRMVVEQLVRRYGRDWPVRQSELDREPNF